MVYSMYYGQLYHIMGNIIVVYFICKFIQLKPETLKVMEQLDAIMDAYVGEEMAPEAKWTEAERMYINNKITEFLARLRQKGDEQITSITE